MSLLHRSTDVVTVFLEEITTDADGNTNTRPSAVGVVCRAVVQPMSRFDGSEKQENVGTFAEERLRLRLVGWPGPELGAQSQVEWEGRRYGVLGEPQRYRGGRKTAHTSYTLVRE